MTDTPLEFETEAMRQLVATDPFLAYTVIRHTAEDEEVWLRELFKLDVQGSPALATLYRNMAARPARCTLAA